MRPVTGNPSRREFLARSAALAGVASLAGRQASASEERPILDFPLVDLHAHLDNSSLEQVLPLGAERRVKFGIVEHAGTKENKYPTVLSNDDELLAYLEKLEGKGVYRGLQAEWTDWAGCFSPEVLSRVDYVLTDAMTFPGKGGRRVKLWEKVDEDEVGLRDHDRFMDRFVDWHVQIIETEPFDILANASWLPDALLPSYARLWTEPRIRKVVDAALKRGVAIEISASYRLPKLAFLRKAKAAGAKFSFGSNGRYPNMGKLDYCVEMARALGLKAPDMFIPGTQDQKAVVRRGK
ncbi:hypothetical protein OJF2_62890 [Aquisphaera giovannonii]|uniref:Amidohydrolase n=1 Tax=Aquisphaera giovannonii TaxID=406548 RepID=A0A5B9WAL4_9BACT|nr:hypothetical protein [Aquisphaera giovannonii]QEH37698.1 hypothetical protein OJF2_62890 [Aquisphaera giovannonii]